MQKQVRSIKQLLLIGGWIALNAGMVGCPGFNLGDLLGGGGTTDPNTNTDPNTTTDPNTNGNNDNTDLINTGLTGKYAGSERCGLCHVSVHDNWSETLHAGAYETLAAIGQQDNDHCIGCHVVGYGEEGGFVDAITTQALKGVGCEACHGPAMDHVNNIEDATKRPPVNLSADVCGVCHTGEHNPNYDEWAETAKNGVSGHVADSIVAGSNLNACGQCHSGTFFVDSRVNGETVADDALLGEDPNALIGITCAVCHDPHMKTGNAAEPEDGRDFQLRFAEVKSPTPTNSISAATDPTRFNLCGQCHHSRGRDWTNTGSHGPHHSVQANIYAGEMPMPEADDASDGLVFSRVSVHSFAPEQCATCHMYREDFMSEEAPAIAGHSFEVNTKSCAISGCHPSSDQALAVMDTLQAEIQGRLDAVIAALDAKFGADGWDYGDTDPNDVQSDQLLKARFLVEYVANDGSLGMHNPAYIRDMLIEAAALVDEAPAP